MEFTSRTYRRARRLKLNEIFEAADILDHVKRTSDEECVQLAREYYFRVLDEGSRIVARARIRKADRHGKSDIRQQREETQQ